MALAGGTLLGPYEILSPLGAGGMGEVYRARDTRLERTVAVKVLNPELVTSPELKARFEREARVISQLQHPNICVLHDIGSENGTDFLVMEYLEGESLADRLRRGPLPVAELLKIAMQIADALDKAHRAGIVHRDLKPGNVMLTKGGSKLLDFGLAKPMAAATIAGGGSISQSVFTAALTQSGPAVSPGAALSAAGSVVGTVQYMAPEQVQGLATDARSDIFSFGAMLYEMATGKRAFGGKTQASIVGQILALDPPPVSTLQPSVPPALAQTIQLCLEKDPDERLQSAHDLKLQLRIIADSSTAKENTASSRSGRMAWFAAAALVLIVVAVALYERPVAHPAGPVVHSTLPPPDNVFYITENGAPVLSPDGTRLAFIGSDDKGAYRLYVRSLDSSSAQPLAGTEGASFPFWSPDSQNIAFFAGDKLKRIPAAGGSVLELAELSGEGQGGSWGANNTILFSTGSHGAVLRQVPAAGGSVSPASQLSAANPGHPAEVQHSWPFFLPDGKHFLFWSQTRAAICLGELGSLQHKVLLQDATNAIYASGYLLYLRGGTLFAQAFSTTTLLVSGDPHPLAENVVAYHTAGSHGVFSASSNGLLVYQGGQSGAAWPLVWYGRDGKSLGSLGEVAPYSAPAISPDGRRIAVTINQAPDHPIGDIWIFDLSRGTRMRVTFDGKSAYPIWADGGRKLLFAVYSSTDTVPQNVFKLKPADNSGPEETVLPSPGFKAYPALSGDSRYLVFQMLGDKTGWDVWGVDLRGDRKPFPVVQTPFVDADPSLSPDGKWLAYTSSESGSGEIYITAFPGGGAKWQVSTTGGTEPRWRGDGKELFFSAQHSGIMAVDVAAAGNSVSLGTPHLVFRTPMQSIALGQFDVTSDGKKFLINSANGQGGGNPLALLTNWTEELKK
jgi:serine/threonine protein kinase